jgi:hypothetical protein
MLMMSIKRSRKAQTGMEYLMTYGWAVLVVGIIILLLLSLKVFDIDWYSVKNEVWMLSSFDVPDFKATPYFPDPNQKTVLMFQLINNRGTNVTITGITFRSSADNDVPIGLTSSEGVYVWYCPTTSTCSLNATFFPFNMTPGQRMIVNGTIDIPGEMNVVFTTKLVITYRSPRSTIDHVETGMMRGRVEPA